MRLTARQPTHLVLFRGLLLLLLLAVSACGRGQTGSGAAPTTPTRPPLPTAAATLPPTAPPTPTPRPPTSTPRPPTATPLPTPTATPLPAATAAPDPVSNPDQVPELVWLPYSFGDYGEPIVVLRDGRPALEAAPTPIEVFFDFRPGRGIAYGTQFWSAAGNGVDSVTDFWLYDFTNDPRPVLDGQVGRVALNPDPLAVDLAAVARHDGTAFNLVLLADDGSETPLDSGIDPYFSFAPDGKTIAYVKDGQLLVAPVDGGSIQTTTTAGLQAEFGWVGDEPLWDLTRELLIFPADPFLIIPLDGRDPFAPRQLDGSPLSGTRPTRMLWSPENRQLAVQIDDLTFEIQVYLLTEDLAFVADTYFLEGATLIGWVEDGETLLVQEQDGMLRIWSLATFTYVDPAPGDE